DTRLTDPCQFDILMLGPGWWGSDAIRSTTSTPIHHAAQRRGGVAARGGRAAGGEAGDHWVLGGGEAFVLEPMGRCFCEAIRRTRLDRWPHDSNRVSLGAGSERAVRGHRGRVRQTQG